MRLTRLLLLPVAVFAVTACSDDDGVSVNARPPLGGVRYINAVPDGGPVDIRMVDQLAWSANSVTTGTNYGMPYRSATIHWATEAKPRHIRVFPTDSSIEVTSQILHDTTITIAANKNITLMLVGTRAANDLHFVQIDDDVPALSDGQIAARVVNAGVTGTVDGYFTATETTDIAAMTPTVASVGPLSASAYVVRATESFAAQVTPAGAQSSIWSFVAPEGAPAEDGIAATAGFSGSTSGLSAVLFPQACPAVTPPLTAENCAAMVGRSAASNSNRPTGINREAYQVPTVVWFADQIPGVSSAEVAPES